tara:strand:+ start:203 stop:514 length:312 start_codon:yes stop_codon:yes gene_type:complete
MLKITLVSSNGCIVVKIPEGQREFTIGRGENNDFTIPEIPAISGTHCKIFIEDDVVYAMDKDSRIGTFHNGQQMVPGHKTPVKHGSKIKLGKRSANFEICIET